MKVTGWTDWENPRYEELSSELYDEAKEVVIFELRKQGYKFTGGYHQLGDSGVPIIDDKYRFECSQRAWGAIMAKAYPEEIDDTDGYGYCTWAWNKPDGVEMVVPGEV